ncbi:MAG: Na+/H+ antiporter [Schlesneria sp.]|nr:Na+/H+ antiporter [Schlesneria sp.]
MVEYKVAVLSVMGGTDLPHGTLAEFTWNLLAGVVAGMVVGQLAIWVRRRVQDSAISSAASLLTSFAAYLCGEALGASGVLATVAAGLWVGRAVSRILEPEVRQSTFSFWGGLNFILEGLAFVLIGLELRPTLGQLSQFSARQLIQNAALVIGAVVRRSPQCSMVLQSASLSVRLEARSDRGLGRTTRRRIAPPRLPFHCC